MKHLSLILFSLTILFLPSSLEAQKSDIENLPNNALGLNIMMSEDLGFSSGIQYHRTLDKGLDAYGGFEVGPGGLRLRTGVQIAYRNLYPSIFRFGTGVALTHHFIGNSSLINNEAYNENLYSIELSGQYEYFINKKYSLHVTTYLTNFLNLGNHGSQIALEGWNPFRPITIGVKHHF